MHGSGQLRVDKAVDGWADENEVEKQAAMPRLTKLWRSPPYAQLVGIAMLAWGLASGHSYAYFILLRWVIFGVFIFLCVRACQLKLHGWVWTLGIAAAIYNPIIRVHLNRELWSEINIVTGGILALTVWVLRGKSLA